MVVTLGTYRDKQDIKNIILDIASNKKQVIYGQQSVNAQLPKHLNRNTSDYDIYTKKPKESAEELADRINKIFGGERAVVKEALHKGTFKVLFEDKPVADYTIRTNKPASVNKLGVKYANINYSSGKLKNILKDKSSEYRHEKDKETLNKINKSKMAWLLED